MRPGAAGISRRAVFLYNGERRFSMEELDQKTYQFENRCTLTKPMVRELIWAQMAWVRVLAVLITLIEGVSALLCVYHICIGQRPPVDELASLIIGLICVAALWTVPGKSAKAALDKMKRDSGGALCQVTIRFGEQIELRDGAGVKQYSYAGIRRVFSLRRSYALIIGQNTNILLDRKGFTEGEFPAFRDFLAQKRPDLKIPK